MIYTTYHGCPKSSFFSKEVVQSYKTNTLFLLNSKHAPLPFLVLLLRYSCQYGSDSIKLVNIHRKTWIVSQHFHA